MIRYDPQDGSPQYLEDLATGYWLAQVLFTAVEMEIFTLLEPAGASAEDAAGALGVDRRALERFLETLCALGLAERSGSLYFNTGIVSRYLVKGKEDYQGDAILWRKHLSTRWQELRECLRAGRRVHYPSPGEGPEQRHRRIRKYIRAMDCVARVKVREILPIFESLCLQGEILDVGAGSGAVSAGFLERYPGLRATLLDLPEVLGFAGDLLRERGLGERVVLCPGNILESWPVRKGSFDLVILSNVLHIYAEEEVSGILAGAAERLSEGGFLIVHDFFREHYPEKAALFDLNMLINTYNGRVLAGEWVRERLRGRGLSVTGLIPLQTDTALVIGTKNEQNLAGLNLDPKTRLISRVRASKPG